MKNLGFALLLPLLFAGLVFAGSIANPSFEDGLNDWNLNNKEVAITSSNSWSSEGSLSARFSPKYDFIFRNAGSVVQTIDLIGVDEVSIDYNIRRGAFWGSVDLIAYLDGVEVDRFSCPRYYYRPCIGTLRFSSAGYDADTELKISADFPEFSLGIFVYADNVVFYDLTPPVVSLVLPEDGLKTNSPNVDYSFNASDANLAACWILLDGSNYSEVSCSDPAEVNGTFSGLSDGTHSVQAFASDSYGNVGQSEERTFSIDTVPPLVIISSPADWTAYDPAPALQANISDSNEVAEYEINCDNDSSVFYPASSFVSIDEALPAVCQADGQHYLFIRALDDHGNSGQEDATFVVDTQPPVIEIVSPENATYPYSTIALEVLGTDLTPISWLYSLNGGANESFTPNATLSGIEGPNYLIVYAIDALGHASFDDVWFSVDTIPPEVSITLPADGFLYGSAQNLQGTISDAQSVVSNWWFSCGEYTSSNFTGNSTSIDFNVSAEECMGEGWHTLSVFGLDAVGNLGSATSTYLIDLTPPEVAVSSPVDGALYAAECLPNFSGSASDSVTKVEFVLFSCDSWSSLVFANSSEYYFDFALPEECSSEGTHNFSAWANDSAGHSSVVSGSFRVDANPPEIEIVSPENRTYSFLAIPLEVVGEDFTEITWFYSLNGGEVTSFVPNETILNSLEGGNCVEVFAYDELAQYSNDDEFSPNVAAAFAYEEDDDCGEFDHSSTETRCWTTDTIPPEVTIFSPEEGRHYSTTRLSLNVAASEPVVLWQYSLNGGALVEFTPNATIFARWGRNNVTVFATDAANNTGNSTNNFQCDQQPSSGTRSTPTPEPEIGEEGGSESQGGEGEEETEEGGSAEFSARMNALLETDKSLATSGEDVLVTLTYNGGPLSGKLVRLSGPAFDESFYTGEDGTFSVEGPLRDGFYAFELLDDEYYAAPRTLRIANSHPWSNPGFGLVSSSEDKESFSPDFPTSPATGFFALSMNSWPWALLLLVLLGAGYWYYNSKKYR